MRKNLVLLYLFISISIVTAGQFAKRDSLTKLVQIAKEDTAAVNLYLAIGDLYEGSEPATAKEYYKKAMALSEKINFKKGSIKSFTYYANTLYITGDYDSLIFYIQKSLALSRETKDSLNIALGLLNIGMGYSYKEDFETAIRYCMEGLEAIEGKAYNTIEVQINDKLQVLYLTMTQYDKAIVYGEKAVRQSRELKMPVFLATSLTNLAMSYAGKKMTTSAKALLLEALGIAKSLGDSNMESYILLNLADLSLISGDYDGLKATGERCLLINRQIGSPMGEALSLRLLGIYYLHQKKFSLATDYIQKSLAISKSNNYKSDYGASLRVLSNISFATGNLDAGEKYDRESMDTLKKMVENVLSEKSANLEKKYETRKKDSRIKQLETEKMVQQLSIRQKNILNYVLIGGAATLLTISLLFFRNYRQKQIFQQQRIAELQTEKQLTATEAVLKGEEKERTRLAKDLHDGLGGMLSGIKYALHNMKGNQVMTPENTQAFERSMDMLDSSIKEMRRVAHNMMPETLLKFGLDTALGDFCNDINQSGALKVNYQSIGMEQAIIVQTTAITIYRVVQELVSNIMKHAAAKSAIVQVTRTGNLLSVTVEDDGKGFDPIILQKSKGIGWSNIRNRVEFLKGRLDVNSQTGKGTSVLIELSE